MSTRQEQYAPHRVVKQDLFATHQASLLLACANTLGPILELGAGHYSTPLLHAFSSGRVRILTLEWNREWMAEFLYLSIEWHRIRHVQDWDAELKEALQTEWAVCFVDQLPPLTRGPSIEVLRSKVDVFVCYDSEWQPGCNYDVLKTFRYYREDARMPRTAIVSDRIDVNQWPII